MITILAPLLLSVSLHAAPEGESALAETQDRIATAAAEAKQSQLRLARAGREFRDICDTNPRCGPNIPERRLQECTARDRYGKTWRAASQMDSWAQEDALKLCRQGALFTPPSQAPASCRIVPGSCHTVWR